MGRRRLARVRAGSTVQYAVGHRRRRRLVDDVEHLQICQPSGVLSGLTPGFVEEGRAR